MPSIVWPDLFFVMRPRPGAKFRKVFRVLLCVGHECRCLIINQLDEYFGYLS